VVDYGREAAFPIVDLVDLSECCGSSSAIQLRVTSLADLAVLGAISVMFIGLAMPTLARHLE
jgi:hypothetical protein